MSERCMVCKYENNNSKEAASRSTFYINNSAKDIHLCGQHSRELFLHGQRRFVKDNARIFQQAKLTIQADGWIFNYLNTVLQSREPAL